MVIPLQKVTRFGVVLGAWFGTLIFQKFQINITEKLCNIFVGYHFFLGLKNCKQDTFHKVDLLIAFALWTQFKQTAKQATIQAIMRAFRSKKNRQFSKTKDVTNTFSYPTGNGNKRCRHPPFRRANYGLLLKRTVKHSQRICDCRLTVKCFFFLFWY